MKYVDHVEGCDKEVWEEGIGNKLGRLLQGYKSITDQNTIFFYVQM